MEVPLWLAEEAGVFLYNTIAHEWAVGWDEWTVAEQRVAELQAENPEITFLELDETLREEGHRGVPVRGGMPTGGPPKALARGLIRSALSKLDDVPWGTYCRTGCEDVAKRIQTTIGGEIRRIEPALPRGRYLGPRDGKWTDWAYHEVVVKDGRVYDALTGPDGLPIDEYKKLWDWADDINFGF